MSSNKLEDVVSETSDRDCSLTIFEEYHKTIAVYSPPQDETRLLPWLYDLCDDLWGFIEVTVLLCRGQRPFSVFDHSTAVNFMGAFSHWMLEGGELIEVRSKWPRTPGIAFGRIASLSALELSYQIADLISLTCIECGLFSERKDLDFVLTDEVAEKWVNSSANDLADFVVPPEDEWPSWQIERDIQIIQACLNDEFHRAGMADIQSEPTTKRPSLNVQRAFDLIKQNGPILGKQVAGGN